MKTTTEYHLNINGIFGRNRKAKSHTVTIGDCNDDQKISSGVLASLVEAKLAELKVKVGSHWDVRTYPVTIETMENGITLRGLKITIGGHSPIMSGTV